MPRVIKYSNLVRHGLEAVNHAQEIRRILKEHQKDEARRKLTPEEIDAAQEAILEHYLAAHPSRSRSS